MQPERRIGTKDSATRSQLLDAAEQLMMDRGYAAVTSRQVGKQAGIAPQLVHYYFRTMDDLFLEMIRRRSEAGLEAFSRAIEGDVSLRRLWELQSAPSERPTTVEFAALARHRPVVRTEIASYGERFRELHTTAVSRVLDGLGISTESCPPEALTLMMTGVAQIIDLEDALGLTAGHENTKAFIEQLISRLEGETPECARA